jgi:hypothetical protein
MVVTQNSDNKVVDALGFTLHPHLYTNAPGSHRVDICITETPTQLHFDPERLHCRIRSNSDDVEMLQVRYRKSGMGLAETYSLIAGPISLFDRMGEEVIFITLGGKLTIQIQENNTFCKIESPVPILQKDHVHRISRMLAEEIEILLAERRAAWLPNVDQFNKKLAAVDPFVLYAASLEAIRASYLRLPVATNTRAQEMLGFVRREMRVLRERGQWASWWSAPSLSDIL